MQSVEKPSGPFKNFKEMFNSEKQQWEMCDLLKRIQKARQKVQSQFKNNV